MNDYGVKETACTNCFHRKVCSLKTTFLKAQKAIDNAYVEEKREDGLAITKISDIPFLCGLTLVCKYYIPDAATKDKDYWWQMIQLLPSS